MSPINFAQYKYTPDEMSEDNFLARFVVREEVFSSLLRELQKTDFDTPSQHYIITGQRGQGKTTLLRKLQIEVAQDAQLSSFLVPVKFAEEQYQIRSLYRLWEEVADYLQTLYPQVFPTILDDMEKHFDDEDYELRAFSYLEKPLQSQNKKLLILIDNIDELLSKLKEKEQRALREILLTSSSFVIVGGSTTMLEQHYDYGKPFYEFFKLIRLQGLSYGESIALLRAIGKETQNTQIEKVIEQTPQRIETLRILTGGVPRTVVMLFDILMEENGNAFTDLLKILDDITPLYKHRMDDLPPPLQDIVHTLAMNWDGMFTKEIANKTRLASKEVASQLKQLEKYQLITATFSGKNKIYQIQERFFNIWYLMRFGRKKDRARVEWLVQFLLSWFSRSELENKAKQLIDLTKSSQASASHILYMSEALSYTGINMQLEHEMKETTKEYLITNNSKLINELSPSDIDCILQAEQCYNNKQIDEAIKLLLQVKVKNGMVLARLGVFYSLQNKDQQAEEYFLRAIEDGNKDARLSLPWVYFKQGKNARQALVLAQNNFELTQQWREISLLMIILAWNEEFAASFDKFEQLLDMDEGKDEIKESSILVYFALLLSKGQFYKVKEFFEIEKYQLKEKHKPMWYALMTLMQDEFPDEIKKMGSELQSSVDAVLREVEILKVKYAI